MITVKINSKPYKIPTSWADVTFAQYVKLINAVDSIDVISIFTGIDQDTLRTAQTIGIESIYEAISFTNVQIEWPGPSKMCGKYIIPVNHKGGYNIQYETLGQFEDMRQVIIKTPDRKVDIAGHFASYGKYVAIYLQKIRDGKYDPMKVPSMEEEVNDMPVIDVQPLGAFFFLKQLNSLSGTAKTSHPTTQNPKKSRPALKTSKRSSGHTQQ